MSKYDYLIEQFKNFNNKTENEKNNLEKEFYEYFEELTNYGFTKQSKKEVIVKKYWKNTKPRKNYLLDREYGKSLGDERDRDEKSGESRGRS